MPVTPTLIARQPQEIQDAVLRMEAAGNERTEIVRWLNERGVAASYNNVLYYIVTRVKPPRRKRTWAVPADDRQERLQQYGAALMAYGGELFTIRNIGLCGPVWTGCTRALRDAGLIEATRKYTPILYRLLVSREELGAWLEARR